MQLPRYHAICPQSYLAHDQIVRQISYWCHWINKWQSTMACDFTLYTRCVKKPEKSKIEKVKSLILSIWIIFVLNWFYICRINRNKTPAQAFTPPADKKKMGTIWIFVYYAVYGSGRGRCRVFLVLKWGGGLNLQIWDLNRAHETERAVFPILQVFSMCRRKLWHKRKRKGYSINSAMNTLWTQNTFTINKTCWQ